MTDFVIRPLETHEEFRACEDLQRQVWGMPERDIVPLVELAATRTARGVIAGAYASPDVLAGFVFGFWGLDGEGRIYHYSRMVGVHPSFRGRGLARRLKLYQRRVVLARGVSLVRWTFDPLEGENASLNVGKLGVVVSDYIVDYYGMKKDEVNRGMPTDRFFVHWHLDSDRVGQRVEAGRPALDVAELLSLLPSALSSRPRDDGDMAVDREDPEAEGPEVAMEIPAEIRSLKANDLDEALRWRMAVRRVSERLFDRGYRVEEFATGTVDGKRRNVYVFRKEASGAGQPPGGSH
jgi:predicted GNAT superfamily acetyltransferase